MTFSRKPTRIWLLCLVIAAVAALAAVRLQPLIADAPDAPSRNAGVDFRVNLYGPNVLVSEGKNPWNPALSVPRFGVFPASPIWPTSYSVHPLLARLDYSSVLTGFMCVSVLLVFQGSRRIVRSLGVNSVMASLVGALVVLSPTHLYNVALGQTGVGPVVLVAFFAVRAQANRSWWHHLELWLYGATALMLFAKPTFALTFLAANLAYENSARVFARFFAAAAGIGLVAFVYILVRSDVGLGSIVRSMRESSTILGDAPVNRMDGDRLDFLSLIAPSPLIDLLMLAVVVGVLVWINRLPDTVLRERLVLSVGVVTIGTYHHVYDSLPLLALMCATVLIWPLARAVALAVGLVVSGWLYGLLAITNAITSVVSIDPFALQSRIIFLLVLAVMYMTYLDVRRRTPSSRLVASVSAGASSSDDVRSDDLP